MGRCVSVIQRGGFTVGRLATGIDFSETLICDCRGQLLSFTGPATVEFSVFPVGFTGGCAFC
jgi:hypothetical protein